MKAGSLLFPPHSSLHPIHHTLPVHGEKPASAATTSTILDVALSVLNAPPPPSPPRTPPRNPTEAFFDATRSPPSSSPRRRLHFSLHVNASLSPATPAPIQLSPVAAPATPAPIQLSPVAAPATPAPIPLSLASTPTTPSAQVLSSASPLVTPKKRYKLKIQEKENGNIKVSIRGSFTPGIEQAIKENPNQIYSLKAQVEVSSPGGTHTHIEEEVRQVGETGRGIKKRTSEHASLINSDNPRRKTAFSDRVKKLISKQEEGKKVTVSVGLLASTPPEGLDAAEKRAIDKCKAAYGKSVLNQRAGGGGGCVVQEHPTITNKEARKELLPLLRQLRWKPLAWKQERIAHQFSKQDLQAEAVVYVFERVLKKPLKKHRWTKRYVGITEGPFRKRLSSHISRANDPEKSTLKDNELYEDMHTFWSDFRVGYIPIGSIVKKGATLRQLERIATDVLRARKRPDGMGGYSLTNGGGGGSRKK